MDAFNNLLEFELVSTEKYQIKVSTVIFVLLIILVTVFLLWLIRKALFRKHRIDKTDIGNTYALYQIIKYSVWILSIIIILNTIGIKITVLLAGSAALLVGIGLGLQQTFNDFISGIIILSEKSIRVGDILEIDGDIVKIEQIGLRTSEGLNRDEISIIIPNSLITKNKVINWSHQSMKTRFKINIGVAYGSNVNLVIRVLEESAMEHPDITDKDLVDVRFTDFGSSSLNFQLLFYSQNIFRIEKVKSEIRKIIIKKFDENKIIVPFPQMDIHLKPDQAE